MSPIQPVVQKTILTGIVETATNIVAHYPSRWALGGAALCGLAATECFIRVFKGIYDLKTLDPATAAPGAKDKIRYNLSADLGGVALYGLLAYNIIPFAAVGGAAYLVGYSLLKNRGEDDYIFAKVIQGIFDKTMRALKYTGGKLSDWVITPILEHVVFPACAKIGRVVAFVYAEIVWPIVCVAGNIIGEIIPRHPVWIPVAVLVTVVVGYHFAIAPIVL